MQDPGAQPLAAGASCLLSRYNATLIHPAAVTQAWPPARPSASAGVASEHVHRPPSPPVSASPSPLPPARSHHLALSRVGDSWSPAALDRDLRPRTRQKRWCHTQERPGGGKAVPAPVWGGPGGSTPGAHLCSLATRCSEGSGAWQGREHPSPTVLLLKVSLPARTGTWRPTCPVSPQPALTRK